MSRLAPGCRYWGIWCAVLHSCSSQMHQAQMGIAQYGFFALAEADRVGRDDDQQHHGVENPREPVELLYGREALGLIPALDSDIDQHQQRREADVDVIPPLQ